MSAIDSMMTEYEKLRNHETAHGSRIVAVEAGRTDFQYNFIDTTYQNDGAQISNHSDQSTATQF